MRFSSIVHSFARPLALALPLAGLLITACSVGRESVSSTGAGIASSADSGASGSPVPEPVSPSALPGPGPTDAGESTIWLVVGGQSKSVRLLDVPTARDLADLLPLSLTFRDLNGVEKIAPLPSALTMDGVPAGDDPEIGDLGYYAPSGDLVLYYGDVGYWTGIVRLGRIEGDLAMIRDLPDGAQLTVQHS
jgi:hypothetical protein